MIGAEVIRHGRQRTPHISGERTTNTEQARLINLTAQELAQAALCGISRRIHSIRQANNANIHTHKSDWSTDIDGAAAELAFAKATGRYWGAGVNTFKEPDVGEIQVRSTNHPSGHLIVRPNDSDDDIFVLLVGSYMKWHMVGCISGSEAKREKFWRDGDSRGVGAWWVPQNELKKYGR